MQNFSPLALKLRVEIEDDGQMSGWYCSKKLDFHPSIPGSTTAQVNYQKKDKNLLVCLNNDRKSKGVLKKMYCENKFFQPLQGWTDKKCITDFF